MWKDPIVADVRRARLEIEKECEEDFALIYARAVEVQKKIRNRGRSVDACVVNASLIKPPC